MAKKRTKAQRSAAAKAAWQLRNLKAAAAPTPVSKPVEVKDMVETVLYMSPPITATATKEGDEFFVTISSNGSVHRHRLLRETMRKLGLDALALVG